MLEARRVTKCTDLKTLGNDPLGNRSSDRPGNELRVSSEIGEFYLYFAIIYRRLHGFSAVGRVFFLCLSFLQ